MDKYEFNPRSAFLRIRNYWHDWAKQVGATKWVVGISGGKDSTVVVVNPEYYAMCGEVVA